jgi:type I restriction enzyme, S subunit
MSVNKVQTKMDRLGDYIEEVVLRLGSNTNIEISGINLEKGFIPTVANMNGVDKSKYKLVPEDCFACNLMHIGRDVKIPIAYNHRNEVIAVSPAYYIFKIKEDKKNDVLGYYLEMLLTRNEFGRLTWFHTDSSIRGNLLTSELNDIQIPLPDIDTQQELVDTYNGLKALAEQNEALIKPLTEACQAYIVDCKKKYAEVELGEYIEEYDVRNSDNKIKAVKSVSVTKEFKETNAKVNKDALEGYKLVPPSHLSYVQTTKNEKCFANALNTTNETYVVTQVNKVIFSKDSDLLDIGFLHLIFRGTEFDRYAIYNSWGSARETLDWSELCRVRIPLPTPKVQQAIVNLYNCAEEAKKIATEARKKMKTLCPALVQKAING